VNEDVTFTAQSADLDEDALTFYIEYGDGETAVDTGLGGAGTQQVEFTHAYAIADTYIVTVWADDGIAGAEHNKSSSTTVEVAEPPNSAPVVLLPSSYSADYNVTKAFLPTSVTDPDNDPLTVWWDWGDGSAMTAGDPGADYSASHKYSVVGTRTITVYADDGHGHNASQTAPVTITETNQKAQAISIELNPLRTTYWVNTTVNFTVTLYDYEGDVVTLTVDWDDGSAPYSDDSIELTANENEEIALTHTFTAASAVPYNVVATVDDNQDHSNPTLDTAEVEVNVSVWTPPSEGDGGGGIDVMTIALIGIVIVVIVLLAVLLLMKRRKKGAEGGESGGMAPPE
jgi:hypothetical protein